MNPSAIKVRDLSFSYPGGPLVLDRVSLDVAHGERMALLGANGAGKSTLALHLNGLHEVQTGEISIGELPMTETNLREIRRRVGMVFQDPDDQLFMQTVRDDVAFGPANLGLKDDALRDVVDRSLRDVDAVALADRGPHHLSGGEKRRVALATVLAMDPAILVLDEPTAGLDPVGRRELGELLVGLDQTLVLITHDLPFVLATCQRCLIMDGGAIVAEGPTEDVLFDEALLASHRLELPYRFGIQTFQ